MAWIVDGPPMEAEADAVGPEREPGMGCAPRGEGLALDPFSASPLFLRSGSGAHVSAGRWSEGSMTRPSLP